MRCEALSSFSFHLISGLDALAKLLSIVARSRSILAGERRADVRSSHGCNAVRSSRIRARPREFDALKESRERLSKGKKKKKNNVMGRVEC